MTADTHPPIGPGGPELPLLPVEGGVVPVVPVLPVEGGVVLPPGPGGLAPVITVTVTVTGWMTGMQTCVQHAKQLGG
jgi:hypothetical protein